MADYNRLLNQLLDANTQLATANATIGALKTKDEAHDAEIEELESVIVSLGDRCKVLEDKIAAGPAQPAPTEPTPMPSRCGLYLPLYSPYMRIAAKDNVMKYPGLPMLFTVNPNSGPGDSFRQDIQDSINEINAGGKTGLGYIATHWGDGSKSIEQIKAEVDKYLQLYTGLKGIMWDEATGDGARFAFYKEITDYARSKGLTTIRANPGTAVDERYIELYDVVTINENSILQNEDVIKARTFNGKYPRSKFNYLAHGIAQFPADWLKMASKYVGTIYITDDAMPNPWDVPATYLDAELTLLDSLV